MVDVRWHGSACVELTYKDSAGQAGNTLLYRDDESRLEVVKHGRPWSFDGDGHLFRLAAEAVMEADRALGCIPTEMPRFHPDYDIKSLDPATGRLRLIEVKN